MEKLIKVINSIEDYDRLLDILSSRVEHNQPISKNNMYDGMIISFMIDKRRYVSDLLLSEYLGSVLDGTMQQLEHIVQWITINENKLIELLKQ